jgi:ABC-type multidrug transport system fused ATPase/permease subunit
MAALMSRQPWQDLRALVWRYRGRLALGFVLLVAGRLSALVLPAACKYLIDDVIGAGRTDLLGPLAAAVAVAVFVQAATAYGLSQVLGVTAQRAIADVRKAVHDHVLRLPLRHLDSTKTGVLVSRIMTDADGIRNLIGTGLVELAGGLVTTVVGIGVLLYLSWRLTLVTILVLAVFGGAMAFAFKRLRPLFYQRNGEQAELAGRLHETLSGIRIVKAYGAEAREHDVFARGVDRLFDTIRRSMSAASATSTMSLVVIGTISVLMILFGGRAIIAGEMTVGDLVMYAIFVAVLNSPVIQMASIVTQLTDAFAGLDRIREIQTVPTEDHEDASRAPLGQVAGDMSFEGVWFAYTQGMPVLKEVSFTAASGSTTALVGASGAGKSTLISLVMAFHRPTQGRVLIDGRDLGTIKVKDYRTVLGAVLQDNFLFDGTIADNIRFSKPGAGLEEVMRASRLAHCHEFVERFEHGYDTVVGERGLRLSGGQRQRVAIARAILSDPRVLILDEATSSLDSESEAFIQDGLRSLRAGRTTFVIAHRFSTIESADQILVMAGGEIVERGTHAELLAAAGVYRQLYDCQRGVAQDRFINPGEGVSFEA